MYKKLPSLLVVLAIVSTIISCKKESTSPDNKPGYYLAITSSDEWGNESQISNAIYDADAMAPNAAATGYDAIARAGVSAAARYATNRAAYTNTRNAVASKIRVKFRAKDLATSIGKGSAVSGIWSVDHAASRVEGGVVMEPVFPCAEVDRAAHKAAGLDLWYDIVFDGERSNLQKVIDIYSELPEIEFVETIKRIKLNDTQNPIAWSNNAPIPMQKAKTKVAMPFNDPSLELQWNYDNTGHDEQVVPGASIELFKAWEKTAGDKDVIVAIIDQGVNYLHEDLSQAMWVNSLEIQGNGIDDDGNGYVDDINGFNFAPKLDPKSNKPIEPRVVSGGKIVPCMHGTHVAGTVGAVNNNGLGGCGIAGGTGKGDGVRLMSCQIFGKNMDGEGEFMAQAIVYAADNGAVIAQNSWSYGGADDASLSIEKAIEYFVSYAGRRDKFPNSPMEGGMVVVSAGNYNTTTMSLPASHDLAIAVAATNHLRGKANYSNYSGCVKLAAPGGNSSNNKFPVAPVLGVYSTDTLNAYSYRSGTSMASPHVSGIAALVVSRFKGNITPAQVEQRLIASCESIADTDHDFGAFMGAGLVNAERALREDDKKPPMAIIDLELIKSGTKSTLKWTVPTDENDKVKRFTIYYSKQEITQNTDLTKLPKLNVTYTATKAGQKYEHILKQG